MCYQLTRPDDDVMRDRLKALAQERRRFGYHRLHNKSLNGRLRDYNETRPHGKVGWLKPKGYARRTQRPVCCAGNGCSDRSIANPPRPVQITKGLSLWLAGKRGSSVGDLQDARVKTTLALGRVQ